MSRAFGSAQQALLYAAAELWTSGPPGLVARNEALVWTVVADLSSRDLGLHEDLQGSATQHRQSALLRALPALVRREWLESEVLELPVRYGLPRPPFGDASADESEYIPRTTLRRARTFRMKMGSQCPDVEALPEWAHEMFDKLYRARFVDEDDRAQTATEAWMDYRLAVRWSYAVAWNAPAWRVYFSRWAAARTKPPTRNVPRTTWGWR